MEQRKYRFSLSGQPVTDVSVSFSLYDSCPQINATLIQNDHISELVDAYKAGQLLDRSFSLSIDVVGVKSLAKLDNLVITRLNARETPAGYFASANLMPKAAAFALSYPAVYIGTNYKATVRGVINAIVSDFNSRYPTHSIKSVMFESAKDPVCVVSPRFLQVSYMDMFKTIASRHGMVALIDLHSRLRVFVPTTASSTTVRFNKHNVAESSLVLDSLQTILG